MLFKKAAVLSLMFLTMFIMVSFAQEEAFKYSKKILLNTSATGAAVSEDLKNLPILIRLTKDNFDFSQAKDNGEDILVTGSDGATLNYVIQNWEKGKCAEILVKVPNVKGNDNKQYIVLKCGNKDASYQTKKDALGKMDADLFGIWHLSGLRGLDYDTMQKGFVILDKKEFMNISINDRRPQ